LVLLNTIISALQAEANQEISINKQFGIINYLKVAVIAEEPTIEFAVDIYFALKQKADD